MAEAPPAPPAAAPAGWLARLPPGLFGIALGLLGLGGAWQRMGRLDPWPGGPALGAAITVAGMALWALLFALWCLKAARQRHLLADTWRHPVQGPLLALWPVSTLLVVAQAAPLVDADPAGRALLFALLLLALTLQLAIAWQVVSQLTTGRMPPELVTPALYLPPVAGGFVGAMALQALGLHGFAVLLFGIGLGGWALLEARILHRLFAGALPLPLRPTLGLELAPTSVGTLALAVLWPELPADVLLVALGIAVGPVLAVLARWRWWRETPFSIGFWSFSFPLAALAGATVEAVRRGGWPPAAAWCVLGVATGVIAFLVARTIGLLQQGRLLPPA